MNGLYSNAEKGESAKKGKERLLRAVVGAFALLGGAFVVGCDLNVANVERPSATRGRLTALEDALKSARNEQSRISALATKRENEARRLRLEFRRAFFRLDPAERDALLADMQSGELSSESKGRPDAATAFAKQSEWFDVEGERKTLTRLSERFNAEIERAESERVRWERRLETKEALGGAEAENSCVELSAVVDRLRASVKELVADAERPRDTILPEDVLAPEKTEENVFEALVGGESGEGKTTREAAGIPELPKFDPNALSADTPDARRLFESQGAEIVEAANREIQNALDAGGTDVAVAATLDAAAKLVELAETLGKDRLDEFKQFQEAARKASGLPVNAPESDASSSDDAAEAEERELPSDDAATDASSSDDAAEAEERELPSDSSERADVLLDPNGPVFGATVQGQEIVAVVPNSPAAIAGLEAGDRILNINGARVLNAIDYDEAVDSSPLEANLLVLKKEPVRQENVVVVLNRRLDPDSPVFGATVQGQEIVAVVPNSPATVAGLRVGDRILTFNGEMIRNAQEFSDAVDRCAFEARLRVSNVRGEERETVVRLNRK